MKLTVSANSVIDASPAILAFDVSMDVVNLNPSWDQSRLSWTLRIGRM